MEYTVTSSNIDFLCRICLTSTKNLTRLTTPIKKVSNSDSFWTVQKMLEAVTFNKIIIDDKKFPSSICQMCLSLLKISHEFQVQFNNSQNILKDIADDLPVEKLATLENTVHEGNAEPNPAPVELIYGGNKFDLKDIVVVEEEQNEQFSFEGFLNNLGTEVSARFVNALEPQAQCNNHKNNKIVETFPENVDVIIEEVHEFNENLEQNRQVKTLFECKRCKMLYESEDELEAHAIACYSPPLQLVCDKCGHIAHSTSALYHHLQNHKGKRFQCSICNKKFVTNSRLKAHERVHKNDRPFLCNVCGKNFNYSVALKYHMRLHTGEKKYVCNFCGLKYTMPNTLQRHLRTHTKDRPYQCKYCDKRFASSGEIKSHEMIHTGLKPYRCEHCGKNFAKSFTLQCHYLSHSGPHECHVCPKTFIDVAFLRTHLKRVHKSLALDDIDE